ncbi:MAG: asparagine synthase (glutamine-hydrolyzing) [Candidatus Latescibacterota bacterium]
MCGIAGVLDSRGRRVRRAVLQRMTDAMAHRGPDGEGHFVDGALGLGHRRLAVIDPSPAGRQPMSTADGRYTISYNGEVYNFAQIRRSLEEKGHVLRSHTDTEVVLQAYAEWGRASVLRFNGMFALAIWDRQRRELFLARDRFGIKPLYYLQGPGGFAFASEVKALLTLPGVKARVWPEALQEYFTFQNTFSDRTLFQDVRLFPAGHTLLVRADQPGGLWFERFWDFDFREEPMDLAEAEEELYRLLAQAVERQLVSDVPLGSYLSGGVDSGSVAGLAARLRPRLATFTGGFDLSSASGLELGFDERATSELLSHHYQTEHYEVVLKAGDMEAVMPHVAWHLEDLRLGQNYPNYYVAGLASRFVKVVLSGAGGDELFAGYPWRYFRAMESAGKADYLRRYYAYWQRLTEDEERAACFRPAVARAVAGHDPFDDFRRVFDGQSFEVNSPEEYVNRCLYFECKTFLHGFFVVEDKLSMAHGLETRVPFLDNDVVDFAMRIPVHYKLASLERIVAMDENVAGKLALYQERTGDGKLILRQAMQRLAPEKVARLRKQGFCGPDGSWFRGESVNYVRRVLLDRQARLNEYLEPAFVRRKIEEHCRGEVNHRLLIWSLLSFEWWLRRFVA